MNRSKRVRVLCAIALFVSALSSGLLGRQRIAAMFASGDDAPVDRLVANITAQLKLTPNDPEAIYLLGRVNALAYVCRSTTIKVFDYKTQVGGLPKIDENYNFPNRDNPNKPYAELTKQYLTDAIKNYRAAIKLAPRSALYRLSLASIIEAAGEDILELDALPEVSQPTGKEFSTPKEQQEAVEKIRMDEYWDKYVLIDAGSHAATFLRPLLTNETNKVMARAREAMVAIWREDAIYYYWMAYVLSIRADLPDRDGHSWDTPISQEAALHYTKLVTERGATEREETRLVQMKKDLKTLESRARLVTPIIFSERPGAALSSLLSSKTVRFDLDGDDIAEECPWVAPDTCILVWDPRHTGQITSGRQLFGSVTWWIFWRDGYQALEALDDNHDGILSGEELRGLAVWRDLNGNGIADEGEVTPIKETGIESIAVHSNTTVIPGPSPANISGIRMKDGRVLPTFDWTIVRPARADSAQPNAVYGQPK